jgi:hypothetical protein
MPAAKRARAGKAKPKAKGKAGAGKKKAAGKSAGKGIKAAKPAAAKPKAAAKAGVLLWWPACRCCCGGQPADAAPEALC